MNTAPCVPCGTTPVNTNIPGYAGLNAWAIITAAFVIPNQNQNVQVAVTSTAGFVIGENVYGASASSGGANFIVVSINSPTSITLEYLEFSGDAAPGASIPVNGLLVPGPGNLLVPTVNPTNATFALIENAFTVPAVGSNVTITLNSTVGFANGQNVYVATQAASGGNFLVYSVNSLTSITLKFLGLTNDFAAASTVAADTMLVPGIGNQTSLGGIPTVIIVNGVPTFTAGLASSLSAGPTAISFPATTVAWPNPNPFNIEVYIDSPSNVITAIKKNGATIFADAVGQTCFTVRLQPGETFTATYATGSPTAKYSPL